ncbi:MAG: thiamine pyrophosphate-dependent dehydrogenase E1 component subunit alpha, partial [Actinomycetota bacterium]
RRASTSIAALPRSRSNSGRGPTTMVTETGARPDLLERYRLMWTMRAFEDACAEGITTGELRGELHLATGQEGVAAGMVGTLQPHDRMVSTHRSHLHAIAKGVPLEPLLAEIYERAPGLCGGKGGHLHLFDPEHRFSNTGIVGSAMPVALGHAYASRLLDDDGIAVAVVGDGAVNAGQFHETLNMAAIWSLPLVVVVENNHYAISVPADDVISGSGIAEKAASYGAWGRRVDGTDVEAVAVAFEEAAGLARSGGGPALLEATCYRFRGHYEGDVDHYRSQREKDHMTMEGDPIVRAAAVLTGSGVEQARLAAIEQEERTRIDEILGRVRAMPAPDPKSALTDVFDGIG